MILSFLNISPELMIKLVASKLRMWGESSISQNIKIFFKVLFFFNFLSSESFHLKYKKFFLKSCNLLSIKKAFSEKI